MLLGCARQRNAELTRFSVQIRTLNAQRAGGFGHPPPMVLKNGRDVVALEPEPRVPEAQQPVVNVWRCSETGEAPRRQGATTENTGST